MNQRGFLFPRGRRNPGEWHVNCLLSFLYTLVAHDVHIPQETVETGFGGGFTWYAPAVGAGFGPDGGFVTYLNQTGWRFRDQSQGRCEGTALRKRPTGAVLMDDETRKTVLVAYQTSRKRKEEITHLFLTKNSTSGCCFCAGVIACPLSAGRSRRLSTAFHVEMIFHLFFERFIPVKSPGRGRIRSNLSRKSSSTLTTRRKMFVPFHMMWRW